MYRLLGLFSREYADAPWSIAKVLDLLAHLPIPIIVIGMAGAAGLIRVMRAMLLEFPNDPTSAYLDRQYMLGDDLLVAPVLSAEGTVTFYVPDGTWRHLLTGEEVAGPGWVTQQHDVMSLPVLVRPGAVIEMEDR